MLNDTIDDDADNTVSLRVYAPDTGANYTVYTHQNGTWASTSSTRDGSYLVFKTMERDLQFAVVKSHHSALFYILIVLIVLAVIVTVLPAEAFFGLMAILPFSAVGALTA